MPKICPLIHFVLVCHLCSSPNDFVLLPAAAIPGPPLYTMSPGCQSHNLTNLQTPNQAEQQKTPAGWPGLCPNPNKIAIPMAILYIRRLSPNLIPVCSVPFKRDCTALIGRVSCIAPTLLIISTPTNGPSTCSILNK